MSGSKVRWGILGAGRIAHTFARDIAAVENAELVAVGARQLDKARSFADQYGIAQAYGNYEDLVGANMVDAVYIATPHNLHYEQCLLAFAQGKHVLCEKPVTVSPEEFETLSAAARQNNCYFMEAMWTYFLPAIDKAREWVSAGRIGKIRQVKADFGYPIPYAPDRREYDASLAGGCLLEMGIYPVAIASLFIDAPLVSQYSTARFAPNGVEEEQVSVLQYTTATAVIGSAFSAKLPNWAYIIGEEGYIAIHDFWRSRACYLYKLDEQVDAFEDGRQTEGFDFEIAAASADILAGRLESSIMPHASSLLFQVRMAEIKTHWR